MSPLEEHGGGLIDNDFCIIPIKIRDKRPDQKNWTQIRATRETHKKWISNGKQKRGVGVLTFNTPSIDVDVLHPEIARLILKWCQGNLGVAISRTICESFEGLIFASCAVR